MIVADICTRIFDSKPIKKIMLTVYNTVIVTLFYCTFMCSLYIKFVEYAYT